VKRAIPIHGIARQGEFKVTRLDARGFVAQFIPGEEARAAYPFNYEFIVSYRFEPLGLSCEFSLENLGREPLPWSAGHHFYFTLPWREGTRRGDYAIRIPATKRLKQDPTGALVAGPQLQDVENLANPALIDTFHLGLRDHAVTFGEKGGAGDLSVRLGAADVPPPEATFVTWTLADDAPFYCVEPWMGPANAPENKLGLHWVPPGKTERFTVSVSVK
jgi:galactose mutarotase-like enzyme